MSFAELKKQSRLGNLTAKLVKEVEKMNKTSSMGDDRFWKIERDKKHSAHPKSATEAAWNQRN